VHKAAVIPYRWKIRTLRDLLRVFFLLNRITRNPDIVVVVQRQLNGFLQSYVARGRAVTCFLGRCKAGEDGRRR
jgi:hypothetical protein